MACQGSAKRACVEYDMPDYVTGYDLQQATRLAYEGDIEAVDAFLRSRPAFKSQLGAHSFCVLRSEDTFCLWRTC